ASLTWNLLPAAFLHGTHSLVLVLCEFCLQIPDFLFFLVHSRPSLGGFNKPNTKPPVYPSCYHCNKSTYGVGTSKKGPVPSSELPPSLILLELLKKVLIILPRVIMTSKNPSSILRDHLYSTDDRLKRGRPPPLLKSTDEDIIIDGEPVPETAPMIDPAETSLIEVVPMSVYYNISKFQPNWINLEPSTQHDCISDCNVLKATIELKKKKIPKEKRSVANVVTTLGPIDFGLAWQTCAHSCRNSYRCLRSMSCIFMAISHTHTQLEHDLCEIVFGGAPTSLSTSLRFSNWVQFFGDVNRNESCRLAALYHYGLEDSFSLIFLKIVCTSGYFLWLWQ
ncbi:unnamed protein product, partial [Prunus brigantina]